MITIDKYLISWLPFDNSTTEDVTGNNYNWYSNGASLNTNALRGKSSYFSSKCTYNKNKIALGAADFTVEGYVYLRNSNTTNKVGILTATTGDQNSSGTTLFYLKNVPKTGAFYFSCTSDGTANSTNLVEYDANYSASEQWVHFAIVYENSTSKIKLFLDGVKKVEHTFSAQCARMNLCLILAKGFEGSSTYYGQCSIDEFLVYDGKAVYSQDFIPPVASDYNNLGLELDIQRKLISLWRYENPGRADLLTVSGGTTVTDLDDSISLTGVAFYQSTRSACFGIAATKEIWIRCDIYTTSSYVNNNRLRIYNDNQTYGANGFSTATTITSKYMLWHNNNTQNGNSYYAKGERRSFLMHMLSDAASGIVEIWTGSDHFSYSGNVNGGLDFDNIYIQMDGANIYVSNLIISNAEIDIGEGAHVEYIDTERELIITGLPVAVDIDVERKLQNGISVTCDTVRNVSRHVTIDFDMSAIIYNKAEYNVDIERKVNRSVEFNCDLWRKIPHIVTDNSQYLQSWSVSIQEQQLTDNVTFVIAGDIDIMDSVNLDILDYELMARAEQTSKRGVMLTCQCTCDIDEILYKQMAYEVPESEWEWTEEYLQYIGQWQDDHPDTEVEPLPTCPASAHIKSIARALGKSVSLQFDDWISTMDTTVSSGTNYAGLIGELFGWTSRLPHLMINCYMRGNTIYVVQRGHEDNEIDIDSEKLTLHTVTKKLIRTTWGSDPWSKTEVNPYYNNWQECEIEPVQESYEDDQDVGTRTYNDDGLVQETEVEHGSERVVTTYEYVDLGDGRKILATETAVTYQGGVEVDRVVTKHNPVGATQSHVYSTDSDGILGGVVTSSNNDDRITPYQRETSVGGAYYGTDKPGILVTTKDGGYGVLWRITYHNDKIDMQRRTINGVALIDTSFPVDGNDALESLTNEIKWLDRKTEESVTLDIYDYPHLIDFNDRIIWQGNTYYLRSNTAVKTETIVNKQTLEFVRWY